MKLFFATQRPSDYYMLTAGALDSCRSTAITFAGGVREVLFAGAIGKRANNNAPLRWVNSRSNPVPAVAKSFVDMLLVGDPDVRLGGKATGGKCGFIHHAFMWHVVRPRGDAPKLLGQYSHV